MNLRDAIQKYAEWCLEVGEVVDLDEAATLAMFGERLKTTGALMSARSVLGEIDLNGSAKTLAAYKILKGMRYEASGWAAELDEPSPEAALAAIERMANCDFGDGVAGEWTYEPCAKCGSTEPLLAGVCGSCSSEDE